MSPRTLRRQLGTYISRIGWIAWDGFRRFPGRIFIVTLINSLGVAAGMLTLGGVLLYAKHLEQGAETFTVLGFDLSFVREPGGFAAFAGTLAAIGAASAGAIYLGEWVIARLTVLYQQAVVERVLSIAADPLCAGWQLQFDQEPRAALSRLCGTGAKLTAFAFRNILRAILPVLIFGVAVAVLVTIDWTVAALIVPVVALWLIPLYLINRGVSRQHRAYMSISPEARRAINASLDSALNESEPDARREAAREAFEDDVHARAASLFWRRKLSSQRVVLANTVLFVVCLIGLFIYFGIATRTGERTWSEFVGFVVALRFAQMAVRRVTGRFIKLSRYLSEYRRFTEFVDHATELRSRRAAFEPGANPLPSGLLLKAPCDLPGSARKIQFKRGRMLWVLSPFRPTRAVLGGVAAALEDAIKEESDFAVRAETMVAEGEISDGAEAIVIADAALNGAVAACRGRFVVVVSRQAHLPLEAPEGQSVSGVVVLSGWSIAGMGDPAWLDEHLEAVEAVLRPAGGDENDDLEAELEDEEDEDDE